MPASRSKPVSAASRPSEPQHSSELPSVARHARGAQPSITEPTASASKQASAAPPMTTREFLRFCWTQLTSMRTALWLLFALVVAAIPGSLGPKILPQRPNNPILVNEWITAHPQLGPLFDRLGLFDVYGSPWFAAIYLLLLTSLIGCIIPRIAVYARAVRTVPAGAPKRFDRLPAQASGPVASASGITSAAQALDAGEAWLVQHRYRVRRSGGELSGERGHLRELGNLVFHLSVLGVLVGVAISNLWGFKGSVIVPEGSAFSNNLSQYDDFSAGAFFTPDALEPFTVWIDRFDVAFERGQVQHGAARKFQAQARLASASGAPEARVLEVNTPIQPPGTMVNLIGHGYAPVVTVTDAQGNAAFSGPVVFLPQDSNFTSLGVIKAPDARPQRVAFDAIFVPSQATAAGTGPRSTFPDLDNPRLWGTAWQGAPKAETGRPENVYSLDKTGLTQVMDGAVPLSFRLAVGEQVDLPDGTTLRFDGVKRWTKLQISSTPGLPVVLGSVALGVLGLCLSLFVRTRRLFARVTEDADGPVAHVGGLDKADAQTGLAEDVAGLAWALGMTADAPTSAIDVESSDSSAGAAGPTSGVCQAVGIAQPSGFDPEVDEPVAVVAGGSRVPVVADGIVPAEPGTVASRESTTGQERA